MITVTSSISMSLTTNHPVSEHQLLVDRFHWCGHVGCSSGYSLDKYTTLDIATINSQINEQANAGLQRIKGQIAYMKPENFVSCKTVFKYNEHGQKEVDVGKLSL